MIEKSTAQQKKVLVRAMAAIVSEFDVIFATFQEVQFFLLKVTVRSKTDN